MCIFWLCNSAWGLHDPVCYFWGAVFLLALTGVQFESQTQVSFFGCCFGLPPRIWLPQPPATSCWSPYTSCWIWRSWTCCLDFVRASLPPSTFLFFFKAQFHYWPLCFLESFTGVKFTCLLYLQSHKSLTVTVSQCLPIFCCDTKLQPSSQGYLYGLYTTWPLSSCQLCYLAALTSRLGSFNTMVPQIWINRAYIHHTHTTYLVGILHTSHFT